MEYRLRCWPLINRQAESAFGDEGVAADRFEWGAGGIGLKFIVPADNPYFASVFQADLRRAQDMPGGVKGDLDVLEPERLAIGNPCDCSRWLQSLPQDSESGLSAPVALGSAACVIAVRVRDQGTLHSSAWVHVEIPRGAVESVGRVDEHDRGLAGLRA